LLKKYKIAKKVAWILKQKKFFLVLDVDGVFTDGKFIYSEKGKEFKTFGSYDNFALKNFVNHHKNCQVFVITADKRGFLISEKRIQIDMGLDLILVTEDNRENFIANMMRKGPVIFVADSPSDIRALSKATVSIAPYNAPKEVKKICSIVLSRMGGDGAVYEVIKLISGGLK
jgi:3-deoxy-D-manno-octulosonate 8-phosphate phosphatase (KDO 8-P phosphatase)